MRNSALLLVTLFLLGCPDGQVTPPDSPDLGEMPDPDLGMVDMGPQERWRFMGTTTDAPQVRLSEGAVDESSLTVTVVGRAIERVHGVSFRVRYDPEHLRFVETAGGSVFSDGLRQCRVAQEGLLVCAISALGASTGVSIDRQTIARLSFERLLAEPSELSLTLGTVLDADGLRIPDVAFVGGRLVFE